MNNVVFWDVALCRTRVNGRFRGTYHLPLQGGIIPCLLDIPCYLLSTFTRPNTFSPLCLFPLWPHSFSPRLLYSGLLQLESQSAASSSHVFTACGLFHPEDGCDTFLRNVGLPEFYTATSQKTTFFNMHIHFLTIQPMVRPIDGEK
jgi:hypothetical protein